MSGQVRWGAGGDPGRASRADDRAGRRRLEVLAAGVVVLLALAAFVVLRPDGDAAPGLTTPGVEVLSPGAADPSDLTTFAVLGGDQALLAVIGSGGGRPPAALVVPSGVTVQVPGQGETLTDDVAALPTASLRTAVSNTVGAWTPTYAITDLERLGVVVDRVGGVPVVLPEAVTIGPAVLGPGTISMSGAQLATYLGDETDDPAARWAAALAGLMATPLGWQPGDLVETSDAAAAAAAFAAAASATVEVPATELVGGSVTVFSQPELDETVSRVFGVAAPIPVLVENGSGVTGVGEAVAARLLPAGYRVVLSRNAQDFDRTETLVIANGSEHIGDAERATQLLGTGTVQVSQVASGLADITVVVGKDFQP